MLLAALSGGGPVPAAMSVYMAPEQLATRAELIVEARVELVASGFDSRRGALARYVTLEVEHVHRGPATLERVVLREPGGRWAGLAHEVDAVARYREGERVLAFLEAGPGGALRTVGMFYGRFRLDGSGDAVRDLDGQGLILGRPRAVATERWAPGDLVAVAAGVPRRVRERAATRTWRAVPAEFDGLRWSEDEGGGPPDAGTVEGAGAEVPVELERPAGVEGPVAHFVPGSQVEPARWQQSDTGQPVLVHVEPGGNPLGDDAAAVFEIERALAAWTAVPEARLALAPGNTAFAYTASYQSSPADVYSGVNVVLFDDPYDDISDPVDCTGVLAIGGYWRSTSPGTAVNGVTFYPAMQLYTIFADGFECFLADPDNLAEVAAHELGHGIGFGHSTAYDSIMRPSAYSDRGPRLGDDDRDAAHCHYPHALALAAPTGGESWAVGSAEQILWTASAEAGSDPGVVDLEFSADGGQSWTTIAGDTPNDGAHDWVVPDAPGPDAVVRVVRPPLAGGLPAGYPSACSQALPATSFSVVEAAASAGELPAGSLRLGKEPGGEVRLEWAASCSGEADDHAIYEGTLDALRAGSWDHLPRTCAAGVDLVETVAPMSGARYYLVAPLAGAAEGRLGLTSSGAERPSSADRCAPRESEPVCAASATTGPPPGSPPAPSRPRPGGAFRDTASATR